MNSELQALQQEVEDLTAFVYMMPVAVARLGPEAQVEMLNPRAVQLLQALGIDVGADNGLAILDALCPGLSARWRASAGRVGAVFEPQRCTLQRLQGGTLHLMVQLVRTDERCTMLAIEDVTTTVEQERELARQRRRLALALEHIRGYGVVMLDREGRIIEWNPSLGRLFGRSEDEVLGQPLLGWLVDEEPGKAPQPDFDDVRAAVARQGWSEWQAPWQRRGAPPIWGDCAVTQLVESDGSVSGYVAVIRDITADHAREQQLIGEALTDPLTGAYNRRGLERQLVALQERRSAVPGRPCWIMIDIDHFKHVNDTHGHDGGDAVLKAVAAALQNAARDGDTLARLGGEEFVLLLPAAGDEVAARVAERLRQRVAALAIDAAGREVRVTASFGVALQAPDEAWTAALERADAALYRAKRSGRNCVKLAEPMGAAAADADVAAVR